jgi:hypothetical protein
MQARAFRRVVSVLVVLVALIMAVTAAPAAFAQTPTAPEQSPQRIESVRGMPRMTVAAIGDSSVWWACWG